MRYDRRTGYVKDTLELTRVRAALRTTAQRLAPVIAATTSVAERADWSTGQPLDPGQTQASTRVESGHVTNDGRPAVRIVQDFAVVPEEFRQNRDHMLRAVSGGGR